MDMGSKQNCQILRWLLNVSQHVFLLFNEVICLRIAVQIKELIFLKCFSQSLAHGKFLIMVDKYNKNNSMDEAA